MIFRKSLWTGVLLIVTGLLIPPTVLIESLRRLPEDPALSQQLLLGASLFKVGLVVLGVVWIALGSPRIKTKLGLAESPSMPSHDAPREKDPYRIPLWGLLILSLGLRLYKLGEGLWFDEIAMCVKYLRRPFGELLLIYDSENQHFLYTILAHICSTMFGENAWALRLPAVFFGLASIWSLYFFGRELTSRREAFLAAALLSLSYYHVWFSQNARGYTGLLFWTLFSSWFFVRALFKGPPRLWIVYAVTVALGIFTQFIMIFVVSGQFLIYLYYALIRRHPAARWNSFFLGFVLAGLLTFQLYALVLPQFFNTIGMKGTVAIWNSPFWTLAEIVRGMKVSFAGGAVALAALIVFLAGLWSYARSKPVLLQLLILPPLLGSSIILALGHPLWPRFFFFAFGFGVLIVVRGGMIAGSMTAKRLQPLAGAHTPRSETAGLVFCCVLILISSLSIPSAYLPKQDFVGARSFIEKNKRPGDAVVIVGRVTYPYTRYYSSNFTEVKSIEALNRVRKKAQRTWLLYMIPEDVRALYPEIMASIQKNFKIVKKFPSPLADGAIYVCLSEE